MKCTGNVVNTNSGVPANVPRQKNDTKTTLLFIETVFRGLRGVKKISKKYMNKGKNFVSKFKSMNQWLAILLNLKKQKIHFYTKNRTSQKKLKS